MIKKLIVLESAADLGLEKTKFQEKQNLEGGHI